MKKGTDGQKDRGMTNFTIGNLGSVDNSDPLQMLNL